MKEILRIAPSEIEKKSFEIITEELGDRQPGLSFAFWKASYTGLSRW